MFYPKEYLAENFARERPFRNIREALMFKQVLQKEGFRVSVTTYRPFFIVRGVLQKKGGQN